jgi:hypothetical protein
MTASITQRTERLHTLRECGRTICGNTCLFPDGTIHATRDLTFAERLTAVYIYRFAEDTIYRI